VRSNEAPFFGAEEAYSQAAWTCGYVWREQSCKSERYGHARGVACRWDLPVATDAPSMRRPSRDADPGRLDDIGPARPCRSRSGLGTARARPLMWADFQSLCDLGGRLAGSASEAAALAFARQRLAAVPAAKVRDDPVEYPGWRCRTAQLTNAVTGVLLQCTPLLGTASAAGLVAEVLDLGLGRSVADCSFISHRYVGVVLGRDEAILATARSPGAEVNQFTRLSRASANPTIRAIAVSSIKDRVAPEGPSRPSSSGCGA
jgi:hypothetical protein